MRRSKRALLCTLLVGIDDDDVIDDDVDDGLVAAVDVGFVADVFVERERRMKGTRGEGKT